MVVVVVYISIHLQLHNLLYHVQQLVMVQLMLYLYHQIKQLVQIVLHLQVYYRIKINYKLISYHS